MKTTLASWLQAVRQSHAARVYGRDRDAVWGRFGHGIDTLAVFATLFGLATSLGLGAQQAAAGLAHLLGAPATNTTTTQVLLIVGITSMALASVVSGKRRGSSG